MMRLFFLATIALAWLFCTSNRELRDFATKALICILIDRINLVLRLLQKFKNIDEPYIKERLFKFMNVPFYVRKYSKICFFI